MYLGVATVERSVEQYIRSTFGSLMEGLAEDERRSLYTIVLIGHTEPDHHLIYYELWLRTLSNSVLTYDNLATEQFNLLSGWE